MHLNAISQIDAKGEAMRQQAVQNLLTNGLKSLGGASPLVQAGVSAGMKEDAAATGAMNEFVAQLAKMNTPAATPVGTPG